MHRLIRHSTALAAVFVGLALVARERPARASDAATCETFSTNAQRLRMSHALVAARTSLLACAQPECPAIIRRDCEKWLAEVDASMATVVAAPRDAQGRDLIDVRVEIDGVLRVERIDGVAIPVDPGPHVFRFVFDGGTYDETIVVREGEKGRLVTVTLARPKPAALSPAPVDGSQERAGPPTAGYIFGGIGVAALATSGVFGLLGLSDYNRVHDSCGAARACSSDELSPPRTKFLVADIALGIGVLSLATAAYFFWFAARPTHTPVAAR